MRVIVILLDADAEYAEAAFERAVELCDRPTCEIVAFRPYGRPFWLNLRWGPGTAVPYFSDDDLHRCEEAELARLCGGRDVDRVCTRGAAPVVLAAHPKLRGCRAVVIAATGRSRRRARRVARELAASDDVQVVEVPRTARGAIRRRP